MALIVHTTKYDAQSLSDFLTNSFPECTVKIQNRSTIIVAKGKIMSVIRIRKDKLTVHGDLNTKNPLIFILVILGILSGVVGVLVVFLILYIIFGKSIKTHKNKVYSLLKENA